MRHSTSVRPGNSQVNKEGHILLYEIQEVPDPTCLEYQAVAGGSVVGAIGRCFEYLLRALACMSAGSCSAEIIYLFNPKGNGRGRQTRLKLYLRSWASDRPGAHNLDRLVRAGPISLYYKFLPIERIPQANDLRASCEIVRREDLVKPLHSADKNYKILAYYYTLTLFTPNRENDYLMLDRVLDCIDEPVAITIRVQPVDISPQIHAHTAYMARLGAINNRWDIDDEAFSNTDYTGYDGRQYPGLRNHWKPLSYKDPLANDILQTERQNHKTFRNLHLSFKIKADAETIPIVRLVASVLGDSAFEDGSFRILVKENGKTPSGNLTETRQPTDTLALPSTQDANSDFDLKEYEQLRPLSRCATVDELLGVFRLPIGGYFSPCCIRKDTDPPQKKREDQILLGYDMEIGSNSTADFGQPLCIGYDQMRKHLFISSVPGGGKSTVGMNILIQLYSGSWCCRDGD